MKIEGVDNDLDPISLSKIELRLTEICCEILQLEAMDVNDDLFDLGCDSVKAMQLCTILEMEFQYAGRISSLLQFSTVRLLAKECHTSSPRQSTNNSCTLVDIQASGKLPPIIVMYSVGGEVYYSLPLLNYLGPNQPAYGLEPPYALEPPGPLIEQISGYADKLCERFPNGPYCLIGYSFGGNIAYELAQELHNRGKKVDLVAMLDSHAVGQSQSILERAKSLLGFIVNFPRWILQNLDPRDMPEFIGRLKRKCAAITNRILVSLGYAIETYTFEWEDVPEMGKISDDMATHYYHIHRSVYEFFGTHQSKPYNGDVMIFRAKVRPLFHGFSKHLGWKQLIKGKLTIIDIPGTHGHLIRKPNVEIVANHLGEVLQRIEDQYKAQPDYSASLN